MLIHTLMDESDPKSQAVSHWKTVWKNFVVELEHSISKTLPSMVTSSVENNYLPESNPLELSYLSQEKWLVSDFIQKISSQLLLWEIWSPVQDLCRIEFILSSSEKIASAI